MRINGLELKLILTTSTDHFLLLQVVGLNLWTPYDKLSAFKKLLKITFWMLTVSILRLLSRLAAEKWSYYCKVKATLMLWNIDVNVAIYWYTFQVSFWEEACGTAYLLSRI